MNPEPLKGKGLWSKDEMIKWNDQKQEYSEKDIKSAVEWLKDKINYQEINKYKSLTKGLCLNDIEIINNFIDKAFEDVMKK